MPSDTAAERKKKLNPNLAGDRLNFKINKQVNEGFAGGGRPVNIRTSAIGEDRIRRQEEARRLSAPKLIIKPIKKKLPREKDTRSTFRKLLDPDFLKKRGG